MAQTDKRGGSPPKPPIQSKWDMAGGGPVGDFDWDAVSVELLGEAVVNVCKWGDAIMVSTTSDGGAVRLTIFEGDRKHHRYSSDPGALEALLKQVGQTLK